MRDVGTAIGWQLWEQDGHYYVRAEQVVAFLSNASAAREVIMSMLRDSIDQDDQGVEDE